MVPAVPRGLVERCVPWSKNRPVLQLDRDDGEPIGEWGDMGGRALNVPHKSEELTHLFYLPLEKPTCFWDLVKWRSKNRLVVGETGSPLGWVAFSLFFFGGGG